MTPCTTAVASTESPDSSAQTMVGDRQQGIALQSRLGTDPIGPSAPYWQPEHSLAASREGWDLFETEGSASGPWQAQAFDAPDEASESYGVEIPRLRGDEEAWHFVFSGTEPHHAAARAFLEAHNPQEWAAIEKVGKALAADAPDVTPQVVGS